MADPTVERYNDVIERLRAIEPEVSGLLSGDAGGMVALSLFQSCIHALEHRRDDMMAFARGGQNALTIEQASRLIDLLETIRQQEAAKPEPDAAQMTRVTSALKMLQRKRDEAIDAAEQEGA